MRPRDDLSSTGYTLADPGQEYLVLQPNEADGPFTVLLEPGTYTVEWFSIQGRETVPGSTTTVVFAHVSGGFRVLENTILGSSAIRGKVGSSPVATISDNNR